MKRFARISLCTAIVGLLSFSLFSGTVVAKAAPIVTTATGYTSAEDVDYQTAGSYIKNWGARGEDCTFLSSYAEDFYTGNNTFDKLSQQQGGTTQTNAKDSDLYEELQGLMRSKHSHQTSYGETKELYRYTDCLRNDSAHISSFYSGRELTGNWDGAATWNREHTWPNSKGLGGNDENDIMMLRPTWVQENSSRGNTAYGKGNGYYYPGDGLRGDCARIVLYVYVRWGNTGKMWGTSGVMESMNVLLEWMAADPVDTWEMGRNDAVESITGTRNVFVDYPEFAWLLFGRDMPDDLVTPSGEQVSTPPAGGGNSSSSGGNSSSSGGNSSSSGGNSSSSGGNSASSGSTSTGGNPESDNPSTGVEEENTENEGGIILAGGCKAALPTSAGMVMVALLGGYVLKRRKDR